MPRLVAGEKNLQISNWGHFFVYHVLQMLKKGYVPAKHAILTRIVLSYAPMSREKIHWEKPPVQA